MILVYMITHECSPLSIKDTGSTYNGHDVTAIWDSNVLVLTAACVSAWITLESPTHRLRYLIKQGLATSSIALLVLN